MKYIAHIALFLALTAGASMAMAQNNDPRKNEKSEIKVNKLDVIYEDEEYKGVVIDRHNDKGTESYIYQAPFLLEDNNDDDDDDESGMANTFTLDDVGAESEDEILLEGFDTAAIHLPKLDVNSIEEPLVIRLRDKARGENFTWPTPFSARPSSHFGPRRRRFHYGLDLAQPTGEPIYAAFDGVVRISKRNRSYGNLVIIHHANGLETYYAHMSRRDVVPGQQVKSGEIIGLCGNTGRSFGSHLHFEIRYMGNALNPEDVLDCTTHDLINDELTITSSSFRKVGKGKHGNGGTGKASGGWYRVRQGDTLEKIARRNGTTVNQLCKLNGISRNKTLHPGDQLRVNGSASKSSQGNRNTQKSPKKGSSTYTVRNGDNLYRIATNNGLSVKELCRLNGLKETSTIRPGQKLKLK